MDDNMNLSKIENEPIKLYENENDSDIKTTELNNISSPNEEYIQKLKDIAKNYNKKIIFEVGDLVQWKEGLKNKKKPEYNQPAIVVEVLEAPIPDKDSNNLNINEKLSLALGFLSENNEFLISYYAQKRFEHYF